jgi:hypothetical protein
MMKRFWPEVARPEQVQPEQARPERSRPELARRDFIRTGGALLLGGSLAACRKSEQGRILQYDQGTYKGKPGQELTDDQLTALRHRASLQRQ